MLSARLTLASGEVVEYKDERVLATGPMYISGGKAIFPEVRLENGQKLELKMTLDSVEIK